MATLCIIDMQPNFPASNHIVKQVCREVRIAKNKRHGIVVLEYAGDGPTHDAIQKLLKRYSKKVFVKKNNNDGSFEFSSAAHSKSFNLSTVNVVGVNRGYCVFETVASLMEHGKINVIRVIEDATWDRNPQNGLDDLKRLAERSNGKVKLVSNG